MILCFKTLQIRQTVSPQLSQPVIPKRATDYLASLVYLLADMSQNTQKVVEIVANRPNMAQTALDPCPNRVQSKNRG